MVRHATGQTRRMTPFSATPVDSATVVVAGEVDVVTAPDLLSACEGLDGSVTIDCRACEFIDSAGLAALLQVRKRLLASGGELRLRDPSPAVMRVLEVSGVVAVLAIERTPATGPAS